MSKHFAELTVACPRCGQVAQRVFIAEAASLELKTSDATSCSSCLLAIEQDGNELTDDARRAFYSLEGCWSLVVTQLGPRRLEALRVLQTFLGVNPLEVKQMLQDAKSIITGTLVEIERITVPLSGLGASFVLNEISP
jgi:hypothetical protein